MTQEEIRAAYAELAGIVSEAGLAWVLSQVEETVQAGRLVERPGRIFEDEEAESYSFRERLLFLIDGLRHAIVHAAAVENEQIRLLRSFGGVEEVSFEFDEESPQREPLRLRGIQDERIRQLRELLDALERSRLSSKPPARKGRVSGSKIAMARSTASQLSEQLLVTSTATCGRILMP